MNKKSATSKKFFVSGLLLVLFFCVSIVVNAQRQGDLGIATGVVNYVGDLGNEKYFPLSSASPGVQITFRNFLNNPEHSRTLYKPFSVEARISWHRLQYDESQAIGNKKGMELRNYLRGIGFKNDLFGAAVNFTYTFYPNRFKPLHKQRFVYFLLAGVGVYYGNPKADLFNGEINNANRYYFWNDGTTRDVAENSNLKGNIIEKDGEYETNLRDWMTEGQGYNPEVHRKTPYTYTNIGLPLGFGVRHGISRNIILSAEFDYYYLLTDYIDDVSGRYATYSELKTAFPDATQFELAKYISDPTGRGTNGFVGVVTSPRGNEKKNDSYTFISLEVSYKITLKKKGIYGQLTMK